MIKMHSAPYGLVPDPPPEETVFTDEVTATASADKKVEDDDGLVSD